MQYKNDYFSISAVLQKSLFTIKKNVYPFLVLSIVLSVSIIIILAIPRIFTGFTSIPYIMILAAVLASLLALTVFLSACSFTLDLCAKGSANFKKLIPKPAHVINYILFNIFIAAISIPFFIAFFIVASRLYVISYYSYISSIIVLSALYYYFLYFRPAFVPLSYVEGSNVMEGITASYELTHGNFWKLFFIFLLCVILVSIGSLFFTIGISITGPLALVLFSCAYLEFAGDSVSESEIEPQKEISEAEIREFLRQKYIEQKPEPQNTKPQIKIPPQLLQQQAQSKPQTAKLSARLATKLPEDPPARPAPRPPVIEDSESYLGKGTDITDYSNVNSNMIDLKNKGRKGK